MEHTKRAAVVPADFGWSDIEAAGARYGTCSITMRQVTPSTGRPLAALIDGYVSTTKRYFVITPRVFAAVCYRGCVRATPPKGPRYLHLSAVFSPWLCCIWPSVCLESDGVNDSHLDGRTQYPNQPRRLLTKTSLWSWYKMQRERFGPALRTQ